MMNQPPNTYTLKQLIPIVMPLASVAGCVLTVTIAFTKVQMESSVNATQMTAIDSHIDRLQQAFTDFRSEVNKDNRERDRLVERSASTNEVQNQRLDQMTQMLRRMQEDYYRVLPRPQRFEELVQPPMLQFYLQEGASELHARHTVY